VLPVQNEGRENHISNPGDLGFILVFPAPVKFTKNPSNPEKTEPLRIQTLLNSFSIVSGMNT
jgi:hypothetical protein